METVETYLELGDALRAKGKWEEAIQYYQKVIELEPDNWLAYHHSGDCWFEKQDWEKANASYESAIRLNPGFHWSFCNLGRSLYKQSQLEEATIYLQKAIEISPNSYQAYLYLGDIYFQQKRWESALKNYHKILEISPNLREVKEKIEWSSIQKNSSQNSTADIETPPIETSADDVRLIAFFLPQYHPIPENDEWWGKGFTEWTNVTKAKPLFEGHYQPRLPADLGFYDLRLPEVRDAQARLAKKYGIYGFCYYYYWFAGKRLLDRPVDEILQSKQPDFPFCLCWANENWSRRWDGSENEILIAQEHSFENNKAFAESLVPFLKDERYIRVHGKPIVLIYRANILPEIEEATELWRTVWRENNVGEVYLCGCLTFGLQSSQVIQWGFDAGVQFPPHGAPAQSIDPRTLGASDYKGYIYDFPSVVENSLSTKMPSPSEKEFFSVITSWDNTARKGKSGNAYLHADPEMYELWLSGAIEKTKQVYCGDEKLVFINAWNEWAEGTYLEPDRKYGHEYLQATCKALNKSYSLKTSIKLLRYLSIENNNNLKNLITEVKIRIKNIERTLELMINQAKKSKKRYLTIENMQLVNWNNNPTYLESPTQDGKYDLSDDVIFSGWSFNQNGVEVIEVKICDNKREIAKIPLKEKRDDVYNSYPECQHLNIGFLEKIKAKQLLKKSSGLGKIDIYSSFKNGDIAKVITVEVKIIEEEEELSGKILTGIKWYYSYKESIENIILKLINTTSSSREFQHLLDELEEMVNHYLSLLNVLEEFALKE